MKKHISNAFFFISCVLMISSCNDNEVTSIPREIKKSYNYEEKTLCERESDYPLVISEDIDNNETSINLRSNDSPLFFDLGCGFGFNNIPISNSQNILPPVIDIKKYIERENINPVKLETPINKTFVDQTVFYTFQEYIKSKSFTNKIEYGSNFNILGIINNDSKTEFNTIFKKNTDIKNEIVLGELTAEFKGSSYSLLYQDTDAYNRLSVRYLDENFIKKSTIILLSNLSKHLVLLHSSSLYQEA